MENALGECCNKTVRENPDFLYLMVPNTNDVMLNVKVKQSYYPNTAPILVKRWGKEAIFP